MELNSEDFKSQEMSCCCSMSQPSEPPHVGKWFSSYKYESPEMSSGEVVMDFVSGDVKLRKLGSFDNERNKKRGEDSAELGQKRKRKMIRACDKNRSLEPDDDYQLNVDSLSLPSEPPDIRNWFSDYVYDSPELGTGASLKMSLSEYIQLDQQDDSCELNSPEGGNNGKHKRTSGNENVIIEKDAIPGLNEARVPIESDDTIDTTDSVSLPSEPPDIRNWFSSYVYESPALFTDSELGLPFVKEIQYDDCNGSIVKRNGRKSNCDISNNFGARDNKYVDSDTSQGNYSVEESDKKKNMDCFPILSDQIAEETPTQCTNHSTSNMEYLVDKTDHPSLRNGSDSDLTVSKCSRRLHHERNTIVNVSDSKFCSSEKVIPSNSASFEVIGTNSNSFQESLVLEQVDKSAEGADKENLQPDVTKSRFVSTKKNPHAKPNQDSPNFLQKRQVPAVDRNHFGISKKVQGSSLKAGSKRYAMSDVINLQPSTEQEISGKWKCPQRSKSNVQPPMKQLRLEQWVTRA